MRQTSSTQKRHPTSTCLILVIKQRPCLDLWAAAAPAEKAVLRQALQTGFQRPSASRRRAERWHGPCRMASGAAWYSVFANTSLINSKYFKKRVSVTFN